jgi:hypothetical protein
MKHTRSLAWRRSAATLLAAGTALSVLAACGDDSDDTATASSGSSSTSSGPLAGVCPDTVKIQTSWYPQPSKGAVYQLVGADGKVDLDKGTYSGEVGGVTVQILAGGPFLGNQSVQSRMYQDDSILLGEISTDDAIEISKKQPVIAVVATLQKSPKAIVFDPATYPDLTSISDVKDTGATVLKAGEDASSDLLIGNGTLDKDKVDYSWDGSPGRFVTSGGKDMLIDYADQSTYRFEHLDQWDKKVDALLLADGGYTTYENSLSVTAANKKKYDGCLKALVPMIQQATADYAANPTPVNEAMEKYATDANSPSTLTADSDKFSVDYYNEHGIFGPGTDGVIGSFDTSRVDALITSMKPVLDEDNIDVDSDLSAADLVTDEYLDTSIKGE